ncbi:hypothetical protein Poli38472_009832 [Pythium oligandrum]|uniref:Ubiquitin-like protease family profile domain-containing protein n=1 Tax=Pythium oligandrum TaxID=41045 RepID=A0A8K1FIQ8_PYTOL|nr:hypothetical protein Poli38472_009832 [Pythium oligandrum]|eukprot:TMW62339.1 hypothetical protein Poli38472_009832 [Pythium oligandrum]
MVRPSLSEDMLKCLRPREWLNDEVISYFIDKYLPQHDAVLSLDCQFFALIKLMQETKGHSYNSYLEYADIAGSVDWQKHRIFQFPVCMNGHWSTLAVENPFELVGPTVFYHMDSIAGYHKSDDVVRVVLKFIACEKLRYTRRKHSGKFQVERISTIPQQDNDYDCGLYVINHMRRISNAYRENPQLNGKKTIRSLCSGFTKQSCSQFRSNLIELFKSDDLVY